MLPCPSRAFQTLDLDGSGVLEVSDLLACLRAKLPPDEVNTALELALQEAGATNLAGGGVEAANGIDFEAFMSLLKVGAAHAPPVSFPSLLHCAARVSLRSIGIIVVSCYRPDCVRPSRCDVWHTTTDNCSASPAVSPCRSAAWTLWTCTTTA